MLVFFEYIYFEAFSFQKLDPIFVGSLQNLGDRYQKLKWCGID